MDRLRNPSGNLRLLASFGMALLILMGIEYLTLLLGLRRGWIQPHVIVGLALIAVVFGKLCVVVYRALRYYTHDPAYVEAGPPQVVMRVIAPVLVLAVMVLLGSGVLLVIDQRVINFRLVRDLHKVSYVITSITLGLHVLIYAVRSFRGMVADLSERTRTSIGRVVGVVVVVAAGFGLALALPHHPRERFDQRRFDHRFADHPGGLDHDRRPPWEDR